MIRSVVVLGGGSAGLLAALTLKRKLPELDVEVIHSSRIGVIGVGEGTVPYVPAHIHGYLGFGEHEVFLGIRPVFKLGVRFHWGPREHFDYTFSGRQYAWRWSELPRNNGYYAWDEAGDIDLSSSLMEEGKALPRRTDGLPDVPRAGELLAWHIENKLFVGWLEAACRRAGVRITDAELSSVRVEGEEIREIGLSDGSERRADFFVDASGFSSELLGRALGEPFVDFSSSLFCDRAVAGGWERGEEPILPYTLSDTMEHGWCWRIDHPERIHRGYVFSSDHVGDDEAVDEYLRVVPKVSEPRIVRFRSGHHRRSWVGNVAAIGNAAGFVEPLEATALMVICLQARWIADGLIDCERRPNPAMLSLYNDSNRRIWEEIRDFLALHYRFNTRLDTPFWRRCRGEIPLNRLEEFVRFYRQNGPSVIAANLLDHGNPFGIEGHLAILMGLKVPHERLHTPTPAEEAAWKARTAVHRRIARGGMGMREAAERLSQAAVWDRIRGLRPA